MFVLTLTLAARAQHVSHWRVFGADNGLPGSRCVSVEVSPGGEILAVFADPFRLAALDGYRISLTPLPSTFRGGIAESPGGQIWAVTSNGLAVLANGEWKSYRLAEIAKEFHRALDSSRGIPIFAPRQGHVAVLLSERLVQFNADDPEHPQAGTTLAADQAGIGEFLDFNTAPDGGLWIAGEHGVVKFAGASTSTASQTHGQEFIPPPKFQLHNFRAPEEDNEGALTVLADSIADGTTATATLEDGKWSLESTSHAKVLRVWRDADGTEWIAATNGLLRRPDGGSEFATEPAIPTCTICGAAIELDGMFWLATDRGLMRWSPPIWQTMPFGKTNAAVESIAAGSRNTLWIVSGGKLFCRSDGVQSEWPLPEALMENPRDTVSIFSLKDGTLLLEGSGRLFQFDTGDGSNSWAVKPKSKTKEHDGLSTAIGLLRDGVVCLQILNPDAPHQIHLEAFDGTRVTPLPDPPPAVAGNTGFSAVLAARNGDLWLGGDHGICRLHAETWRSFTDAGGTAPDQVIALAQLNDGRIWCATRTKVWQFEGRNWSPVQIGFEHINVMQATGDGTVWVGDNRGLHRFSRDAWVDNSIEDGLSGASVSAICENSRGEIWVGTSGGLSLYRPNSDADPPATSIEPSPGTRHGFPDGGIVTLAFGGRDKWNSTPASRLSFSWRLDELDWSPFQLTNRVALAGLSVGQHYFQVRAMDRNGNVDRTPALLAFAVTMPWYRETRVVLIAVTCGTVALFFALLAFNRHLRLRRSYAEVERQVAQRTRELELANRELLHNQKMTALGTLAAGIAHDFNNILSIIKGSAQLVEENMNDPAKIRTRLDRIKTVVGQGGEIVRAMLGFSRGSGETEPAELNEIVSDTIRLLGDRFLRDVEIQFDRGENLPPVSVPRDFIQQIVLNFVFNAAEAMSGKRRVVIRTQLISTHQLAPKDALTPSLSHPMGEGARRAGEGPRAGFCTAATLPDGVPPGIVLAPAGSDACICISVQDFGCGISPENLPRVFEPFFTTKAMSARRGTGLGLSMVYELARKMDAGLAVESELGRGSKFTLLVPAEATEEL